MMILIIGKNNSGKSAWAEKLSASLCTGKLYYIATMLPLGDDYAVRIEKHRRQRENMGFITIESPYAIANVGKEDTVLLEDISNLVANFKFELRDSSVMDSALKNIGKLKEKSKNLIAVSIDGLEEGDGKNLETKDYIAILKNVNSALKELADTVIEMENRQSVLKKGILPCVF
ncbi:MAG: bifunctional adenosylcobinamide kinase/adenosylcobinamide-phosphate guanylyltransferase [Clostridia bacterium]